MEPVPARPGHIARGEWRIRTAAMVTGAALVGWWWFETPASLIGPAADLVIFGVGGLLLIAIAIPSAALPGMVTTLRREFDRSGTPDDPPDGQPLS
jgi:hypothetical protein